MILGLSVYFILLDLYIFAFAGWIYESTFVTIRDRKPTNRGFLVGPIIPLYGFGAVTVYILLRPFSGCASLLYIMGMVVATVLEYITSWLMEIAFHAKWWDYSKEPYNFRGRIALIPSMFWGILSLLMFDVFQPAADWIINKIPYETGKVLLAVFMILTVFDLVYTAITTVNFRKQLENLYEFRKELEYLLEEVQFVSLRDILRNPVKATSAKRPSMNFNGRKEAFYQKLNSLKENSTVNESKFAAVEERFRFYWENRSRFLKKRPFTGNQRILDAFPSMKILSKNHTSVEVKELLLNMKQKANPFAKHSEGKEKEQTKD